MTIIGTDEGMDDGTNERMTRWMDGKDDHPRILFK